MSCPLPHQRPSLRRLMILLSWLLAACGAGGNAIAADTDPARSACYRTEQFSVQSEDPGITLAGDFTVPTGKGPFRAVQMITGNGPHTRDEMISRSPTFPYIAEHLARNGIAVLRSDARGFGGSSGEADYEAHTTVDRARDNLAIYRYLQSRPEVDKDKLVLFGHSEGAMIAVMLAAQGMQPAMLALMGPSTLPGREVLAGQMRDNLRRKGADAATADAVYGQLLRFFDFLVHGGTPGPEFAGIANDFLAAHGVKREEIDPKFAQGLLSGYFKSDWDKWFAGYDPGPDLRKVTVPVAVFVGDLDENVPWRQHLPVLVDAMAASGNTDLGLHVIPGQDHYFFVYQGKRLEKHRPGEMQVDPRLLAALDAELALHGLMGKPCHQ